MSQILSFRFRKLFLYVVMGIVNIFKCEFDLSEIAGVKLKL